MENEDLWKVIHKYFEDNPQNLVTHHIESYNDFFKNGIFQIFIKDIGRLAVTIPIEKF